MRERAIRYLTCKISHKDHAVFAESIIREPLTISTLEWTVVNRWELWFWFSGYHFIKPREGPLTKANVIAPARLRTDPKISIYWTSFLARGPFRGSTQKWRVFCWGVWPLWRKIDPILQCCLFSLCMLEWPCCPRLQFQREWALMCLLFIDKPLHLLLYLHLLSLTGSKELYFTLYTQPLLILTISMLKKY